MLYLITATLLPHSRDTCSGYLIMMASDISTYLQALLPSVLVTAIRKHWLVFVVKCSTKRLHVARLLCSKVNDRLKEQVDKLWHTTNIYLHNGLHEYAEKLTAKLPEHLQVGVYNYTYNACIYTCAYITQCAVKRCCAV